MRRDHVTKGAGRRSGSEYYQDIYMYAILQRINKKYLTDTDIGKDFVNKVPLVQEINASIAN